MTPRLTGRGRWLILLAALFAFSWQSFVAETHQHFGAGATSPTVVAKAGADARPTQRGAPDSPANCPICRELAHSAYYLPPAPIVFAALLLVVTLLVGAAGIFLTLRRRTHGWRSRAPPSASRT